MGWARVSFLLIQKLYNNRRLINIKMKRNQNMLLLLISLILFAHILNRKLKRKSKKTSNHLGETSHHSHYPISKYPPRDMTERDWPEQCKIGQEQTPIDLPDPSSDGVIQSNGEVIRILESDYKLVNGRDFSNKKNKKFGMDLDGQGSLYILKNGIKYKYDVKNIHLHIPSEHTFKGRKADMEIHIVHMKDKKWLKAEGVRNDPDFRNEALVLGTTWVAKGTENNPLIESLNWTENDKVKDLDMTPWAMMNKSFWHYEGSLTVPNCNEFINWILFDEIQEMSTSQFESMKKQVYDVYANGNARKVKKLNNRKLYYVQPGSSRNN
jgi:carbonic anhydrase